MYRRHLTTSLRRDYRHTTKRAFLSSRKCSHARCPPCASLRAESCRPEPRRTFYGFIRAVRLTLTHPRRDWAIVPAGPAIKALPRAMEPWHPSVAASVGISHTSPRTPANSDTVHITPHSHSTFPAPFSGPRRADSCVICSHLGPVDEGYPVEILQFIKRRTEICHRHRSCCANSRPSAAWGAGVDPTTARDLPLPRDDLLINPFA